ncbi:MAG: hypothetical protein R2778_10350 [Saprospiraceae bacterium]
MILRVVDNVRNGTFSLMALQVVQGHLIDSQADVGGWPLLNTTMAPTDSSNDGMPDDWKTAKSSSNEKQTNGNDLSSGYDNVGVYINSLVEDIVFRQQ